MPIQVGITKFKVLVVIITLVLELTFVYCFLTIVMVSL